MFAVKDLVFRYPGNREETLQGVSFQMHPGEIFGLLGPSGVGKSTTQKILTKLLPGYGGQVVYQGRDLRLYGKDFYQDIGVGFEMPVHFSKLTAGENLAFFKGLYQRQADTDALLDRVGLLADKDKKVAEFSKGMKVRLNFVRALLNQPRMLFLDEPTAGLDPQNAKIIKEMVKEFRQDGGTVLLTTHLMNDVDELCDQVAFMANGRIAEIDSPKNLKLKHGSRDVEVEYSRNGQVLCRHFSLDDLGSNAEFLELIQQHTLITIHSKETTLDHIFIEVTGTPTPV